MKMSTFDCFFVCLVFVFVFVVVCLVIFLTTEAGRIAQVQFLACRIFLCKAPGECGLMRRFRLNRIRGRAVGTSVEGLGEL